MTIFLKSLILASAPPPKSTKGARNQAFKLKSRLICFISIAALPACLYEANFLMWHGSGCSPYGDRAIFHIRALMSKFYLSFDNSLSGMAVIVVRTETGLFSISTLELYLFIGTDSLNFQHYARKIKSLIQSVLSTS